MARRIPTIVSSPAVGARLAQYQHFVRSYYRSDDNSIVDLTTDINNALRGNPDQDFFGNEVIPTRYRDTGTASDYLNNTNFFSEQLAIDPNFAEGFQNDIRGLLLDGSINDTFYARQQLRLVGSNDLSEEEHQELIEDVVDDPEGERLNPVVLLLLVRSVPLRKLLALVVFTNNGFTGQFSNRTNTPLRQFLLGNANDAFTYDYNQLRGELIRFVGFETNVLPSTFLYPALATTLRYLQSPPLVGLLLWILYNIVDTRYNEDVQPEDRVTLKINFGIWLRRRLNYTQDDNFHEEQDDVIVQNGYINAADASSNLLELTSELVFNINDLIAEVARHIYGIDRALRRDESYDILVQQEDLPVLHSLQYYFVREDGDEAALNARQVQSSKSLSLVIFQYLSVTQAYRVPKSLFERYREIAESVPIFNKNMCIAECFIYLRGQQLLGTTIRSVIKEWMTPVMDRLEDGLYNGGNLLMTIQKLLIHQKTFLNVESVDNFVYLGFFNGFGIKPVFPLIKFIYEKVEDDEEDCKNFTVEMLEEEILTESTPLLVYTNGHLLLSTYQRYNKAVHQNPGLYDRITEETRTKVPEPYILRPIDMESRRDREIAKHKKREEKYNAKPHLRQALNTPKGAYDIVTNTDNFAADFETGHCFKCSEIKRVNAQCARAAGVAWGTQEGQGVCFIGEECECEAADKTKYPTMEYYHGCVTQMLVWLRTNWGFFYAQGDHDHAPTHIVKRVIYFFNGSRFDLFFLHKVLLFWNEPVDILDMDGQILKLTWGNYEFVDFLRVMPGGSLDSMYKEVFKNTQMTQYNGVVELPASDKWQCFPYELLDNPYFETAASLTEEELKELPEASWGGKDVPSGYGSHAAWWIANIGHGYIRDQHLTAYCMDDVYILYFMVFVRTFYMAQGEVNGKYFNIIEAITASDGALKLFRQCFLEQSIQTPDLLTETDITDPLTQCQVNLQRLFKDCYKGGKVDVFHHGDFPSALREEWEAKGQTFAMQEYDVNSMYPFQMLEHDLPTYIESLEDYQTCPWEVLNSDQLKKFDMYWCSVDYPQGKSGILCKYGGFCVAVSHLPFSYEDPAHKGATVFNMVYGIELMEALKAGATVRVKYVIHFACCPVFKDFIKVLYQARLDTDSDIMKTFWKLVMNSTYGKLAQGIKATPYIMYNDIDTPWDHDGTLVNYVQIPGPREGHPLMLAHVLYPHKSYVGQLVYMGAAITAASRAYLCEIMRESEKCFDLCGHPVKTIYCDTDSIKILMLARDDPRNAPFIAKYIDFTKEKKIGKLKPETKHGMDFFRMLRKKLALWHLTQPERPWKSGDDYEDTVCEIAGRKHGHDGDEWVIKAKGLKKKNVPPQVMYEVSVNKQPQSVSMGLQFRHTLEGGIYKEKPSTRCIGMGNSARGEPDSNGWLPPHEDFNDFMQRREALKQQVNHASTSL